MTMRIAAAAVGRAGASERVVPVGRFMVPAVRRVPESVVDPAQVLIRELQEGRTPRDVIELGQAHGSPYVLIGPLAAVFEP